MLANARARYSDDSNPLGEEATRDETKGLHRGFVEPLRVVDDTDQRLLFGGLCAQCQERKRDEKAIWRRAGGQAE